jgi:hypothetical protein
MYPFLFLFWRAGGKTLKKTLISALYFIPIVILFMCAFMGLGFKWLVVMLLFVGMVGSTVTGFIGNTATAVVSGLAILASFFVPLYGHYEGGSLFGMAMHGAPVFYLIPIIGCTVLVTAFMIQTNKTPSKARILYFSPVAIFIFLFFREFSATLKNLYPEDIGTLLLIVGVAGSTLAGLFGSTPVGIVSGLAILASSFLPFFDYFYERKSLLVIAGHGNPVLYWIPIMGCAILATALIKHTKKAPSKARFFYYISFPIMYYVSFQNSIFSSSIEYLLVALLFAVATGSTIAGFVRFSTINAPLPTNDSGSYGSSGIPPSTVSDRAKKTLKKVLIIIVFFLVFATFGSYSKIIYAIGEYTYENLTSTWIPPEPLGLENWIDHAAGGFAGGAGTVEEPYTISTPEQLAYLAKQVNEGNSYQNAHIKILNDIDLAGKAWTPIGNKQHSFSGVLDGGGAVIYNLTIATSENRQGFIGSMQRGYLTGLTLVSVDVKGRDYVGGLVGTIGGYVTIRECSLSGTIEGRNSVGGLSGYGNNHTILYCSYSGNVKGHVYVGGLVGNLTHNEGDFFLASAYASQPAYSNKLRNSGAAAVVSGKNYVGGLVGYSEASIEKCYFAGKVIGEAFCAGISGFASRRIRENVVFLTETGENAEVAGITNGNQYTWDILSNTALRQKNDEWHYSTGNETILLPVGKAEKGFLREVISSNRLTESDLARLPSSIRVLNVSNEMNIPQNAPLSVDLGRNDYLSFIGSYAKLVLWTDDISLKMSGDVRTLFKGIYIIPCIKNVEKNCEVKWVLLNVI